MKIKKFIKQLYIGRFCSIYSKQYAYMLKVNNIPNAASPGEEKWGGYWKTLGVNPLKETYRVFYQYMGDDLRILPETTCHYVIEPILNPEKWWDSILTRISLREFYLRDSAQRLY